MTTGTIVGVTARQGDDGLAKIASLRLLLQEAAEFSREDRILEWSSADDGSGSMLLELANDLEISVTATAKGVQFSFAIVAGRESDRSRMVGTIVETRRSFDDFLGVDATRALDLVRTWISDWRDECCVIVNAVPAEPSAKANRMFAQRAATIIAAEESAVADVVACVACGDPHPDTSSSPAVFMVHPTRHSACDASIELHDGRTAKLDPETLARLSDRMPRILRADVLGGGYSSAVVTFEAWKSSRWEGEWGDALDSMRRFAALGIGRRPMLRIVDGIA
jgi:hypothetical protein